MPVVGSGYTGQNRAEEIEEMEKVTLTKLQMLNSCVYFFCLRAGKRMDFGTLII